MSYLFFPSLPMGSVLCRDQCFVSQIRIQYFRLNTDPDPGLWWPIWKKNYIWDFFDQTLQFTYPQASLQDVQAAGEVFSPQKRKSRTWNFSTFFYLNKALRIILKTFIDGSPSHCSLSSSMTPSDVTRVETMAFLICTRCFLSSFTALYRILSLATFITAIKHPKTYKKKKCYIVSVASVLCEDTVLSIIFCTVL